MSRVKRIKVHREGAGVLLVLFAVLFIVNGSLFYFKDNKILFYCVFSVSVSVYLILYNFFRCPPRRFPSNSEGLVIAPADGKIVAIEEVMENEYFHGKRIQVSIFMSLFNVHANWFPVNGTVVHVSHRKGRFHGAFLPKSSMENERSTIAIRSDNGLVVLTRQIAGAMARRIVTYAKENELCDIDEQMGFIKFGSRVDTFLPVGSEILVTMKQKVTGNQTPIARLNDVFPDFCDSLDHQHAEGDKVNRNKGNRGDWTNSLFE